MFENITAAPADPILGLADLFRADDRLAKSTWVLVYIKMKPAKPRS